VSDLLVVRTTGIITGSADDSHCRQQITVVSLSLIRGPRAVIGPDKCI